MSTSGLLPALRVARRSGEMGPILSCAGDLTIATVEILARELELLVELPHPMLTVDLSGCRFKQLEGMLDLLRTLRRLSEKDRRVVLIAGTGWMACLLGVSGIEDLLPVFPTLEEAVRAQRLTGPPLAVLSDWEAGEARADAMAYWQGIREARDEASPAEVLASRRHLLAADRQQEAQGTTRNPFSGVASTGSGPRGARTHSASTGAKGNA
jgi:hypothetical protein